MAGGGGKPKKRRCGLLGLLCASVLLVAPIPAEAFEVAGGVSVGGIQIGAKPQLAVTPQGAIAWRIGDAFLFAVHDLLSILPVANERGVGVHNQTSLVLGYATESARFSAGPSLSVYSMIACNSASLCGRVVGLSPGGNVQASWYFAGPFGISVSGSVSWVGGRSLVLRDGVAAMVVAGPVLRWATR